MNVVYKVTYWCPGYVGSKSFLEQVSEVVVELKTINKMLIYGRPGVCFYFSVYMMPPLQSKRTVCDPVLGDNGQMVSMVH